MKNAPSIIWGVSIVSFPNVVLSGKYQAALTVLYFPGLFLLLLDLGWI
jgi:hypothetical protein